MLRKQRGASLEHGLPGPRVEVAPTTSAALREPRALHGRRNSKGRPPVALQSAAIVAHPEAAPFVAHGDAWRDAVLSEWTSKFGAVGPAESAVIQSAAIELAANRYLMARVLKVASMSSDLDDMAKVADLMSKASKLAAASRQNTMAAWEMLVRGSPEDEDIVDADAAAELAEQRAAARRAPSAGAPR